MIKALLLIFLPQPTWEHIAGVQRKAFVLFLTYLLPLLLITTFAECYGLVHWGKPRGQVEHVTRFTVAQATVFGVGRILSSIAIVLILAKLIKALGETFHGRHSIHQVFTLAAYSLSPLFVVRIFNMFPGVSPWLTWVIGLVLSLAVLYHGLPVIMKPDPPHAFGLYLMSSLMLTIVTGLICFLTVWYLRGKFVKLDDAISNLIKSAT
ncbi:MAG TPA: Yip1 family protein [Verrucomicrobiae bacterium]|nr:Yip1 family protein [Verrucomicrobiae bacterium]